MNDKNIVSMTKPITEYKAILFDVDGTLYEQRKLRLAMGFHLFRFFVTHPGRWKELRILMTYRFVREHWAVISVDTNASTDTCALMEESDMESLQYEYTAKKLHLPCETVKETVTYWMLEYPLQLLPHYQDMFLTDFLASMNSRSVITAAYSDYPAADKLTALKVNADYIFCSSDKDINCMKPDPRAMQAILKALNLQSKDALMIGDRYSKDGLAAKNTGMDFIILAKSIPARRKLYRSFQL